MKHWKLILSILALAAGFALMAISTTGCNTSQQAVAYKTLYSVEKSTAAAYDGYLDTVIKGQTSTNSLPRVGSAFNHFQASYLVALDAVQFNTNALAPTSLLTESQDVLNLITSFKGK